MDRRTIIIAVLLVIVIFSLCSVKGKRNETYAPGSVDAKPLVKKYIEDNADVLSEKPFIVYGLFKQLTKDEKFLNEVLQSARDNDSNMLLNFLEGL
jgi:uncharacterized membrane protein